MRAECPLRICLGGWLAEFVMVTSDGGLSDFSGGPDREFAKVFGSRWLKLGCWTDVEQIPALVPEISRAVRVHPQSSRRAESPSGAGVVGAVEAVAGGVRSAHQVRGRAIGSTAEQEGQHVDRVGDIDGSVIVVIACVRAGDRPTAREEYCQVEDGIGQVSGAIRIAIAALESGRDRKQDDQIVFRHGTGTAEVGEIHFVGDSQRLDKIQPAADTTTQRYSTGNRRVLGLQAIHREREIDNLRAGRPEGDVNGPAIGEQFNQHQVRSVSAIDRCKISCSDDAVDLQQRSIMGDPHRQSGDRSQGEESGIDDGFYDHRSDAGIDVVAANRSWNPVDQARVDEPIEDEGVEGDGGVLLATGEKGGVDCRRCGRCGAELDF